MKKTPPVASTEQSLRIEVGRVPAEGLCIRKALPEDFLRESADQLLIGPGGVLDCHVDRGDENSVHVQGSLAATIPLQCGRCLNPFSYDVAQRLDLFFLPQQGGDAVEDEVELTERDLVVTFYKDGQIDLEEMVREHLLLALPMRRLCSDDCAGLCPTCGVDRNKETCACPAIAAGAGGLSGLADLLGGHKRKQE
jgi:uncharacterized metal-binding protein YceD (DUF177 family)